MWIVLSLLSAVATSLVVIFSKIGIKNVNSNFATLYKTLIVLVCAFVMCLITNKTNEILTLNINNVIFLVLSSVCTALSWLCYYKAIKIGNVNKVVPIDKASFILTTILFLIFFFDDTTKGGDVLFIVVTVIQSILIFIGMLLMIDKKQSNATSNKYLIYAVASSIFASFVSFFVKLGLKDVNTHVATFTRTFFVLIFIFFICVFRNDFKNVNRIDKKSWIFLTLSGLATGIAWMSEYEALNSINSNPICINSIGKMSILITMAFSYYILKEKFSKKSILGLILLTTGILLILIINIL